MCIDQRHGHFDCSTFDGGSCLDEHVTLTSTAVLSENYIRMYW